MATVHPLPPPLVGCVPGLVVGVEFGAEVGVGSLETAALKKDHVSPGANFSPLVPEGSGTWPPPCAIQVTGALEQLYVVFIWLCCPDEGSGEFLEAQPLVCIHLSRSWRPRPMPRTLSAAPWIPRYATGVLPPEHPESWAPAITDTALKTSV